MIKQMEKCLKIKTFTKLTKTRNINKFLHYLSPSLKIKAKKAKRKEKSKHKYNSIFEPIFFLKLQKDLISSGHE